jgi:hypothetical protein
MLVSPHILRSPAAAYASDARLGKIRIGPRSPTSESFLPCSGRSSDRFFALGSCRVCPRHAPRIPSLGPRPLPAPAFPLNPNRQSPKMSAPPASSLLPAHYHLFVQAIKAAPPAKLKQRLSVGREVLRGQRWRAIPLLVLFSSAMVADTWQK